MSSGIMKLYTFPCIKSQRIQKFSIEEQKSFTDNFGLERIKFSVRNEETNTCLYVDDDDEPQLSTCDPTNSSKMFVFGCKTNTQMEVELTAVKLNGHSDF